MKKILLLFVLFLVNDLAGAQPSIPETDIQLRKSGQIKPRKASQIKASYLGIGCEVLDRDFARYESYREYLGNLGVKHARFQSGWAKTEKKKEEYDFSWLDAIIDDCRSRGIQPWINTVYGNPIYEGGGDMQSSSKLPQGEEALKAWESYIRALVTRFRDRVFEWEVWNEVDHGGFKASTPEDYARFYIRTAVIIREVQPESKIIALSLAGVGDTPFVRAFMDYMKKEGKIHLIDKVTFHGYPYNPDTGFDKTRALINLLKQYDPEIEAFQGETGCPSSLGTSGALSKHPFSELTQAKWDLRRALSHIGRGISFSLFTLSEFNYPGNRLNTKGKLKIDENLNVTHVKQSYYGYQILTSLFDSTTLAGDPSLTDILTDSTSVIYPFEEIKNESLIVAYWNSEAVPSERLTTGEAAIVIKNRGMPSPRLVDIRTGVVYKIPGKMVSRKGDSSEYRLPVYDSPLLLCSKKYLRTRGLL